MGAKNLVIKYLPTKPIITDSKTEQIKSWADTTTCLFIRLEESSLVNKQVADTHALNPDNNLMTDQTPQITNY